MQPGAEKISSGPGPNAISWVRKRGGGVVAFDPVKLQGSIYAAREELGPDDAAFHAHELSQAVLHFLADQFEGQTPSTEEIAETVVKVLREMGQGPTAGIYFDYQQKRRRFRENIEVVASSNESDEETRYPGATSNARDQGRPEGWDKSQISWSLQTETELDPTTSREVAASVEKKLLACDLAKVPVGLIHELIDCELLERGLHRNLRRRRILGVPVRSLERLLDGRSDPDQVHRWAGRELLHQFALQEVFSRDIAALHEEGLVHLFDACCPGHWAACSLDTCSLAGKSRDTGAFLQRFEAELDALGARVEGTVAIDALDSVLALTADPDADPAALAEQVAAILLRIVRGHHIHLVVNLFGRITPAVADAMSEGPLFRVQPNARQLQLADTLALQCAAAILREPQLANKCRIDFHPDVHRSSDAFAESIAPWARWTALQSNLCFSFDHDRVHLAEGLTWTPASRSASYQYIGIRLPLLLRKLPHSADHESFIERLGMLCKFAVQAGVQKREFLRRQQGGVFARQESSQAAVVVVPIGLDAAVTKIIGKPIAADDAAVGFAEQLLGSMLHRLRNEGRYYQLRCAVDGMPRPVEWSGDVESTADLDSAATDSVTMTGNTPAIAGPGPRSQIAAGAKLQAIAAVGTTCCRLSSDAEPDPEQIAKLIQFAAMETSTCRLRFLFPTPARQPALADEWLR